MAGLNLEPPKESVIFSSLKDNGVEKSSLIGHEMNRLFDLKLSLLQVLRTIDSNSTGDATCRQKSRDTFSRGRTKKIKFPTTSYDYAAQERWLVY